MSWLAAAASYLGQRSANKANLRIAREQMDFQERMSNTAYTRAARDLENAGLNRILALGSPASSPGGQTATMQNEAGAGVASALQAAQISMHKAQANLIKEQTYPLKVQNDAIRAGVEHYTQGKGVESAVGDALQKTGEVATYAIKGHGDKPGWLEELIPHGATTDPDRTSAKVNPLTPSKLAEVNRAYQNQIAFYKARTGKNPSEEYKANLLRELKARKRRGESLKRYYQRDWSKEQ